jgi:hypothetical protein
MDLYDGAERHGLRRLTAALAAAFSLAPAQWAPGATPVVDASRAPMIMFKICTGWRAWNHFGNLVVVCPGIAPPAGSIPLREYYSITQ